MLLAMREELQGFKRHVYVDSKIQYFEAGDVPVDSQHWHVDGTTTARGPAVERLGHGVVHDMLARMRGPAIPPQYLSYQSSRRCATRFVTQPVTLRLPALIANFDELDRKVRALAPACEAQPAAAIVRFDGLSLHRAVAASGAIRSTCAAGTKKPASHCLDHPDQADWGHDGPSELRDLDVEVEALIRMGDLDVARGRLGEYMAAADTLGSEHGIARAIFWRGELHRLEGRLDDAEREFERAYLEAWDLGLGALAAEAMMKLAEIAGVRGDRGVVDARALTALGEFAEHRPERRAELLRVHGLALGGEQGLLLLARAVELREDQLEAHPGSRELLSQAQESYGRGLLDVGRAGEALEQLELSLATHQDEFGHGTWRVQGILRQEFLAHVDLANWLDAEDTMQTVIDTDAGTESWPVFIDDVLWSARVYQRSGEDRRTSDMLQYGRRYLRRQAPRDAVARFDQALVEFGAVAELVFPATAPP